MDLTHVILCADPSRFFRCERLKLPVEAALLGVFGVPRGRGGFLGTFGMPRGRGGQHQEIQHHHHPYHVR